MTYRRLGDSGLVVSVVGIGCNNFGRKLDLDGTRAVVDAALDAGITLFDTADIYGRARAAREELLGAGARAAAATTWCWPPSSAWTCSGAQRPGLRRARLPPLHPPGGRGVAAPARHRLHRPVPAARARPGAPRSTETLAALDELVRDGKVRYIGHSNFAGWQIADADWVAASHGLDPRSSARRTSTRLLDRGVEAELVPACERFGLGVLPFFPLANGLLTGKYQRGEAAPGRQPARRRRPVRRAARRRRLGHASRRSRRSPPSAGCRLLQVAIGGLAAQPAVASVIAGATTPEQVRANAAAGVWQPTDDGPGRPATPIL